ncbi:MAG: lactate utilization protein [Christensenellales bacterium]
MKPRRRRLPASDMPAGETVGFGGCMTAKQMGLETLLRANGHKVLWHWETPKPERPALLREAMNAPLYVCSANAVTEDGLMVQIDGTGNRVGAMCYGPGTVYVLIGRNKIVSGGYAQAVKRIKEIACPQNARRQLHNPCAEHRHAATRRMQKPICHVIASFERAPNGKRTQAV